MFPVDFNFNCVMCEIFAAGCLQDSPQHIVTVGLNSFMQEAQPSSFQVVLINLCNVKCI